VHPWLSGLLNLRGNLVPIFDLHKVLAEPQVDQKHRRLFSIDRGEKAVALWIDSLPEIKDRAALDELDEFPILPDILQHHVTHAFRQDGQLWLSVQLEAFFLTLGQHQYSTAETLA
jgi:twitching motility protein PilI